MFHAIRRRWQVAVKRLPKVVRKDRSLIIRSPTSTESQALNIVLSKVLLQRRLIGVMTTAETERWIL